MKIETIFAVVEESMLSVKLNGNERDELADLFESWNDIEYLRTFFKENQKYLVNGFWGNISVNEAVQITLEDAENLEDVLKRTAQLGKNDVSKTLQTIFKALNDEEVSIPDLQKSKLKGNAKKSWLRIYAIRIGPNTFVVSGGGIKLTHKMKESEHLLIELQKLEATREYLKEMGILDENDYEYLEIR